MSFDVKSLRDSNVPQPSRCSLVSSDDNCEEENDNVVQGKGSTSILEDNY